jgi:hypothetical protein
MTYDDWKLRAPEDDRLEADPIDREQYCEPCSFDDHHECEDAKVDSGVCECPCRDGYEKTRFGWHRPITKKGQSK